MKTLARWRQRLLKGTSDHYDSFFPRHPGALMSWLLGLFYSGITFQPAESEKIRGLPPESVIVYVSKYKSRFEHFFYHTRYDQLKLPVPEFSFDHHILLLQPISRLIRILAAGCEHLLRHLSLRDPFENGYAARCLASGTASHLSLVRRRGFYKRFVKAHLDPLFFLVELQQRIDRPVFIVPQLMFFGRNPVSTEPKLMDMLFGSELRPGRLRRLVTMFKHPGRIFVEISEPLDLRAFLDRPDLRSRDAAYQALVLRRELLRQINRHRQTITGPALKSRQELKEGILTGDRMTAFLNTYAAKENIPLAQARRQAAGYLDEIAAGYSITLLNILSVVVRFLMNTMFDGISVNAAELRRIKEAARRGPLVLIPCHKSHIDYLLLSYLLFNNNMPCPLVAAGKNLSFFPLGPLFRNAGAFFIRRTFKGKPLYAKVFSEYVYKILQEGFNIEFFIEGGRSRTGKMILPKMGLLSTLIRSYQENACEDLIFTPIFIGYDRVLEESAYLKEMEGGAKEPENLSQVIRARRFLKKRYGRVYVRFQAPFSFKELMDRNAIDYDALSPAEQAALSRNVAFRVINAINAVTIVTPHALVAATLLNLFQRRFTREDLMDTTQGYLAYLEALRAPLADTLVVEPIRAIEQAFEAYQQRRFIESIDLGKQAGHREVVYTVNENKRPNLEYYKNNTIHFFVPAAATALSILDRNAFQFASADLHGTYRELQQLFKNEFAYDIERQPEYYVRKTLKTFIDDAILMPHPTLPDTYNLTAAGYKKLKLFGTFLQTYLESYWIVVNHFRGSAGQPMEVKDRLKKIEALGARMFKTEEIQRKEALSRINYKNAVDFFLSRGIGQSADGPIVDAYADKIRRYLNALAT
jgi:glycerol-3-phosphate O-acyltransferase